MRQNILGRQLLGRQCGYILLPVVLLISLVATAAFMLNNESVLETGIAVSSVDVARANYVADAGLQHALWQVEQAGCGPYTDISAESFGDNSYSATITPNNVGGLLSTFTVAVTDDAWIKKDAPTQNYGNDAQLTTYFNFSPSTTQRALYRFDVAAAGVVPGTMVVSAVARIFVLDSNTGAGVTAHQITADWTEAGVNWDNINSNHNSSSIASIAAGSPVGEYVNFNITGLVQGWINGSVSNQGIMLKTTSIGDLAQYTSKEYGTASQRPELVIKVTDGSLSNRVDISATGTLANGISKNLSRKDIPLYQASPLSLTLQPGSEGKDAEIWDQQPNNNYGNAAETWVSSASNDKTRSLLQFNMNAIPAGAKIQSATLSLYRQSGSGANQPVSAHRILNPWSENSVTWNNRETGTSWDTTGSDFDNMAVVTTPVGPANQRYEWNITPLVQGWVDGSFQNYGVVLAAAIAGMSGERFYTSDSSDPTRHPRLTITYACECGITCQSPQGSGNILLVVGDAAALATGDIKKQALFKAWGYNINLIDDDADQPTFDAALANNDVAYISETIWGSTLATKLADTDKGVVNEEEDQNSSLGLSSSGSNTAGDSIEIIDNSHYITALFSNTVLPIFSAPMEGMLVTGTPAAGLQILGNFSGTPSLALVDQGGVLGGSKIGVSAPGRRVAIPIGSNDKFNWDYLNNNGRLIVQRAIQWGIDGESSISPPKKIYWTDDNGERIQRSDEDGTNIETIIINEAKVRGLDIDTVNRKIYWTRDTEIRRADIDGSNIETIYSGSSVTFDIKLDVAAGKMYWSHDNSADNVMRANLDGSNSETINSSLDAPSYLTLDTAAGHLYVTEFTVGNVSRMNLDGSALTTLITGPNGAVGNALDIAGGKMYWSGGASNDWIKRADLDGSNEETIITGLNAPQDIVYDADNDRIYWVDALVIPSIKRANADGSNVETIVTAGLNRPRGIVLVNANLVQSTGPIAHWKLDESSGTTAVDSEGGHDGALSNGPVWTSGQDNGALEFDGVNDYVDLTSDAELDDVFLGGATVMAWIRPTSWGESDHGRILDKSSQTAGDRDGWMIAVNGDNPSVEIAQGFDGNRGYWRGQAGTLSLNEWTHVAFVYDASSDANDPIIYLNGVALSSMVEVSPSGTIRSDASISLRMGNHAQSTSRTFDGKIDDVRIYDRMLGAAEILAIAGVGVGGGGGGSGSCDGTFRDEFNLRQYDQNDGTLNWATDWEETGESFDPTGGDIRIDNDEGSYELKVRDDGQTIMREADLSQAGAATLSFDYWRKNLIGSSDYVAVEVSYNGGSSWIELDRFTGDANDGAYSSTNYTLDAGSLSVNTRIRFLTPSSGMSNSNVVLFDNVQIQCSP